MKRSDLVFILCVGASVTLVGTGAYVQSRRCNPDASGNMPRFCPTSSRTSTTLGIAGSGGGSGSGGSFARSEPSSAHSFFGGFGRMGAFHGFSGG